jgi:serine phosphatase RsbU (regulator of sigma subunit)
MIALSDGMGKGESASGESALTITSLYNLIKAGFDVELALKTINPAPAQIDRGDLLHGGSGPF